MRLFISALAILTATAGVSAQDLAKLVAVAADDAARLPAEIAKSSRYLRLDLVPVDERERLLQVLAGHVNHLSRESVLVSPAVIRGSAGALLRVNLDDYRWPRETWEQFNSPYDHVTLVRGSQRVRALAPWLSLRGGEAALAKLVALTGSQAPIIEARWFVWQTGIQADRGKTGYYDWLGVKNQADYFRLVGFDPKLQAASFRRELLEAVAESGVSQQPRRIGAFPTIGRLHLWRTFDNKIADDRRNPLRVLDDGFQFDASEEFGPLPNGLWTFGLFDAKGARQDSAPDFIGPDTTSVSRDGRIHVGLSCVRCHYPEHGLRKIDAWARNLFKAPLFLQAADLKTARELRERYLRDLDGPLEDDRRTFTRALKTATGLEPPEYSKAYGRLWADFEASVTPDRAARELGVSVNTMQVAFKAAARAGQLDVVLGTLLQPRGHIPLRQWLEVYPLAQAAVAGVPGRWGKWDKAVGDDETDKDAGPGAVAKATPKRGSPPNKAASAVPSDRARIIVLAPQGSRVWFDRTDMGTGGTEREFTTASFRGQWTYTVAVVHGQRVQERRVTMRPGDVVTVNFK